jgi:sulfoxide reductase catalytic subunit YedY
MSKSPFRRPFHGGVTPEQVYLKRRKIIAGIGLGVVGLGAAAWDIYRRMHPTPKATVPVVPPTADPGYKPQINAIFATAPRPLSLEQDVLTYNNFYEFSTKKELVSELAQGWKIDPYGLQIDGLVDRPGTLSLEQVEKLGLEERIDRFRCVEAWAMTVPWSGVSMAALMRHVGVKSTATHVAFHSVLDPDNMPGQKNDYFTWPYYEGLRIDEAANVLTFIATGLYGKRLSPQNGSPLRVVLPWKYGYKGPKSVVRMTFLDHQPKTFWNDSAPTEYDFFANVDPTTPHPRWSQATERLLGSGDRVETLPYNGYGEYVAALYL